MSQAEQLRDAMIARLAQDPSHRETLVEIWVDHLLETSLAALIHPTELAELILEGMTRANVEQLMARHLDPGRQRMLERWVQSGEMAGDLFSVKAKRLLLELAERQTSSSRMSWARGAVDPALVRELIAPVLQELLISFARKLPLPSLNTSTSDGAVSKASRRLGGLGSRFKERVGKRAERLVDVGRSALGGLGAEFEQKLQSAAREFSQSAGSELREAFEARMASEEGQALLAKIRVQLVQRLLETPLAELASPEPDAEVSERLREIIGLSVDHNRTRGLFRQALIADVEAFFEVEGERTVRAYLLDSGQLDRVREMLCQQGNPVAAELLNGEPFQLWLGDLITAALESSPVDG